MAFTESLIKARSSSALLKYQKRKMVKQLKDEDNFLLSSCNSMLPISFNGGISDVLKINKIKKCKNSNKKNYKKNDDLRSPVQTQKIRNINYKGGNKNSTRLSHALDSSRSYNQYTKEDTYSSCNISDVSQSCEKVRKSNCIDKSSSSIYYGTSNDKKKNKNVQPSSPKCVFKSPSKSTIEYERQSGVLKSIANTFINQINNNEVSSKEIIDIEHEKCKRLLLKSTLFESDMIKILIATHNRVLFEATRKLKNICDEKEQKINCIMNINRNLEERCSKLNNEVNELIKQLTHSRYVKEPKVESSVFNYEKEVTLENKSIEVTEQISSAIMSVAQEVSFENSYDRIEIQSNLNESSKNSFSVNNEEPKAKNLKNYDMKHEICFNKMKNNILVFEDEVNFNDFSEKSQKFDLSSNLQANMKKFGNYQIGRNQNMKETKSAILFQLKYKNNHISDSESKTNTEDLELSISSSDCPDISNANKIQYQKRTNSDFCTPSGKCDEKQLLARCASQNNLMKTISESKTTFEERYLCNKNLKIQNEQLNERFKKYKNCIDKRCAPQQPPNIEFDMKSNDTKYTIAEESAENKISSIAMTIPLKAHDFNQRIESKVKDYTSTNKDKIKCVFEIESNIGTQSSLDIFKAHYSKNIKKI